MIIVEATVDVIWLLVYAPNWKLMAAIVCFHFFVFAFPPVIIEKQLLKN